MSEFHILSVETLGYLAATMGFLVFCMRTMLSLRVFAIASNVTFLFYASAAELTPFLVLHGALLPLNVIRLVQMQMQANRAEALGRTGLKDRSFEWLEPFSKRRTFADGEAIFDIGDHADSLYVVLDGEVELPEIGLRSGPGALLGEIGLFSADRKRTASARAAGPVTAAQLTEKRFKQLYFNNPKFAYQLGRLITQRLIETTRTGPVGAPHAAGA